MGGGKRRPGEKSDERNERSRHVARNRIRYGIALLVTRFSNMAAVRTQMAQQSAHAHAGERPFVIPHHMAAVRLCVGIPPIPQQQRLQQRVPTERVAYSGAQFVIAATARRAGSRVSTHAIQRRSNRSRGIPPPRAITLVVDVD